MVKDTDDVLHITEIWQLILIANSQFHRRSHISHYLRVSEERLGTGAKMVFNSNENISFVRQEL